MKLFSRASIFATLLFSAIAVIPFLPENGSEGNAFAIEISIAARSPGYAQVYFDLGVGFSEEKSFRLPLRPNGNPSLLRLPLPAGRYRSFRVDPIDNDQPTRIHSMRILNKRGDIIRQIDLRELRPTSQIAEVTPSTDGLNVIPVPGANDPQLVVTFDPPLILGSSGWNRTGWHLPYATGVALVILFGLWAADRVPSTQLWFAAIAKASRTYPDRAVTALAGLAVIVACYPVVFLGKSYVSPNYSDGTYLLYDTFPTVPGSSLETTESSNGSDVGAIAWAHLPYNLVQNRAIFSHGEVPLWNRYNLCGTPLLGQGQSMLGEPLNMLVAATRGAPWAWDVRYVVSRWLFACGLGLIVLHATRHLSSALITAVSAAFIGFYLYRVNHPANFSMAYAPWILFAWLRFAQTDELRTALRWIGLLILFNWCEITSGTAKEAYILVASLQVTGGLLFLVRTEPFRLKASKATLVGSGLLVFLLMSSPIWLVFLDTLQRAHTSSNEPSALQISPSLLIGLFDELFYRPLLASERVWNPSVNFLTLLGVAYVVATLRRAPVDRLKVVFLVGAFVGLAFGFGLIPSQWIAQLPILKNVHHIDDTFSGVLIVHLLVLAGFGYALAASRLRGHEARGDLVVIAGLFGLLVFPYLAYLHTVHREPFGSGSIISLLRWGQQISPSPFVWKSLAALLAGAVVLGLVVLQSLKRGRWTPAGIIVMATCVAVMLWRFGHHAHVGFKKYVFTPPERVDLYALSPAIDFARADQREPIRVMGTNLILNPGWSGAYNLESTAGADAVISPEYRELLIAFSEEAKVPWIVVPSPTSLAREKPFHDLLNVGLYLDRNSSPMQLSALLQQEYRGDLDVYRSNKVWPRAFFTDRLAHYDSASALARMVAEGDGRAFAAMATADRTQAPAFDTELSSRTVVPATDYHLTCNTTSFTINAPTAGMVVLHETWWQDDFRATINGEKAGYVRVNHAFKGVALPAPGTYRIQFAYWPRRLSLALWLAASGIALACGTIWSVYRITAKPALGPHLSSVGA